VRADRSTCPAHPYEIDKERILARRLCHRACYRHTPWGAEGHEKEIAATILVDTGSFIALFDPRGDCGQTGRPSLRSFQRLLKNSIPEPLQGPNPPALRAAPFAKGGFCAIPPFSKGGQGGFINSFSVLTEAFHRLSPGSYGADRLRGSILKGGAFVWFRDYAGIRCALELMERRCPGSLTNPQALERFLPAVCQRSRAAPSALG